MMPYQSKSRRASRWNKTRAVAITIIVHFLLLFAILILGKQEIPESIKAYWKNDKEEVVKP